MNSIEFSPDGPHFDDYTIDLAAAYAETVRVLNHATMYRDGMSWPSTAYSVVGNLAAGAAGLRQLLDQIGVFLDREDAAGRLGDDRRRPTGDPATTLAAAHVHLTAARLAAAALSVALGEAHSALSSLYTRGVSGEGS